MAKDLPYFKFFCSEWNDGDITLESYEIQGLFINICSYYWSKECNVTKKLIYKRFKDQSQNIDVLVSEKFLKFNNEHLNIAFLDEQLTEVESTSKSKSIAGKKSAKLKKLRKEIDQLLLDYCLEFKEDLTKLQQEFNTSSTDVDFLLQHISTIKIRRDKKREDNIILLQQQNLDSQEEVKPELDKSIYYKDKKEFLEDWNNARIKMKVAKFSNFNALHIEEDENFRDLQFKYTKEQFKDGLRGLFMQKDLYESMSGRPKHFLSNLNIEKYIDAKLNNKQLYETKNKYDVKL